MSKYIIHTTEHPYGGWLANFDGYDGAPDAGKNGILGHGVTEEDAIVDLITDADDLSYYAERERFQGSDTPPKTADSAWFAAVREWARAGLHPGAYTAFHTGFKAAKETK